MSVRISTILLGVSMLVAGSSCIKRDNIAGPNASLQGSLFQDGTSSKNTVQVCTGNFSIRLEQLSWSATPAPQDIPVKYDGTYENSQLFSGHYRVSIKGGAFWPVAPQETDISKGTKLDFNLTPYVVIVNFTAELVDTVNLVMHFDMQAPVDGGIPTVVEMQPFVNTTSIVGPGASIFDYSDAFKKTINKEWELMSPAERSPTVTVQNLLRGRTFFVRMGVRFNNDDKSYNLSEVMKIEVPK
jgi:hypothetical protein